jgi:hypothetical protein
MSTNKALPTMRTKGTLEDGRENSFFLTNSLKFLIAPPSKDPIPMFPLGD